MKINIKKGKFPAVYKFIIESVMIFLSVIGAFWFEDYRHNRQEDKDYKESLILFRKVLYLELISFKYPIDSTVKRPQAGYRNNNLQKLDRAINLLESNNKDSISFFVSLVDTADMGLENYRDWRFQSKAYLDLTQFSEQLRADSLFGISMWYEDAHKFEDDALNFLNSAIKDFQKYTRQLDFSDYNSATNFKLIKDNYEIKNQLEYCRKQYKMLQLSDEHNSVIFSVLLQLIDEKLQNRGVDISQFETHYIIKGLNRADYRYVD